MSRYHLLTEEEQTGNLFRFVIFILRCKYLFTKGLIVYNNVLNIYVLSGRQLNILQGCNLWTKTILIQ